MVWNVNPMHSRSSTNSSKSCSSKNHLEGYRIYIDIYYMYFYFLSSRVCECVVNWLERLQKATRKGASWTNSFLYLPPFPWLKLWVHQFIYYRIIMLGIWSLCYCWRFQAKVRPGHSSIYGHDVLRTGITFHSNFQLYLPHRMDLTEV